MTPLSANLAQAVTWKQTGTMMNAASDIAIVGVGLRMPGARDLSSWDRLINQVENKLVRYTTEELLAAGNPKAEILSADYVPVGGYLDGADTFEPEAFGFNPLEARLLDPQFRKLLECCHEALDMAGQWQSHEVSNTAVYASCGMALYAGSGIDSYLTTNVQANLDQIKQLHHLQLMTLTGVDWISTTLSHRLGLTGPSVSVQTACSSSITALHMAVTALQDGQADAAIVGASAIHVPLRKGYRFVEGGIFSRSGHCKPFSAESDGSRWKWSGGYRSTPSRRRVG